MASEVEEPGSIRHSLDQPFEADIEADRASEESGKHTSETAVQLGIKFVVKQCCEPATTDSG